MAGNIESRDPFAETQGVQNSQSEANQETPRDLGETGSLPKLEVPEKLREELKQPEAVPEISKSSEKEKSPAPESEEKPYSVEALNKLTAKKTDIENQLSHAEDLSNEQKIELQKQKKDVMQEMIEKGCEVLQRTADEEKRNKAELEEKEWAESIRASGFKTEEDYVARQRQIFIIKELESRYDDLVAKNEKLSDKQKKALLDPTNGEISVGGIWGTFLGGLTIEKEDVAIAAGIRVGADQIKRDGLFSKKILFGKQSFDNINKFNEFIAQKRAEFIDREVRQKVAQNKRELLGSDGVSQIIMQKEINEIKLAILASQKTYTEVKEPEETIKKQPKHRSRTKIQILHRHPLKKKNSRKKSFVK